MPYHLFRKCSISSVLGNLSNLVGKAIKHPFFVAIVVFLCGSYLTLYLWRCGWLLVRDLLGYQRQHYICVSFIGRLGNLMFQYAFLYAFAKKKDLAMIFPDKLQLTDIFEITSKTPEEFGDKENLCWCCWTREDYLDCAYDEHLENLPSHKDLSFFGLFQSWMYWKKIENELREQFKFKSEIINSASKQLKNVLTTRNVNYSNIVLVGMHIRRGDFVKATDRKFGKLVPDEDYFINAMKYFRNKFKHVLFIACSDDIPYTRQTLSQYDDVHVVQGNSAAEDMAILSLTNHTIMTVGTFGWWAGFLANGTTIYYKHPYVEGSEYSKQFKRLGEHFYPGWIPME